MIAFFANLFGYVLNFLYEIVGNYGFAIILFSILVKLVMLPISISQQKTMKKSQKVNKEMQRIQFVYKNDSEKMNQEVMDLYKREKMSPFSGCLSSILQLILLLSVFYLVRSPLTYMKKIDSDVISKLETVVEESGYTSNYKEIAIINYVNNLEQENSEAEEETEEDERSETDESEDVEEETINVYEYKDEIYINMEFFGLDLSKVPTENLNDLKVLIIPILYVISSAISIRISNNMNNNKNKTEEEKNLIGDGKEPKPETEDPMAQANKSMNWLMPIMAVSISCVAPLGLALYWLMNNILMIAERLILNKVLKSEEEAKKNA